MEENVKPEEKVSPKVGECRELLSKAHDIYLTMDPSEKSNMEEWMDTLDKKVIPSVDITKE